MVHGRQSRNILFLLENFQARVSATSWDISALWRSAVSLKRLNIKHNSVVWIQMYTLLGLNWMQLCKAWKFKTRQGTLNVSLSSFSNILFPQSVTATSWALFMTGVMTQATVSAKMAPRGPNVTTVCQDSTLNKAVTVSTRILMFGGAEELLQAFRDLCESVVHLARAAPDFFFTRRGTAHVAH